MSESDQVQDVNRNADFLRERIDHFMEVLNIEERTSAAHADMVHYEEWVRYLAAELVADAIAVACGVSSYDPDVLNHRIPDLLDRALAVIPVDVDFIGEVMPRLPDHERMKMVSWSGMPDDRNLADHAKESFTGALHITLGMEETEE